MRGGKKQENRPLKLPPPPKPRSKWFSLILAWEFTSNDKNLRVIMQDCIIRWRGLFKRLLSVSIACTYLSSGIRGSILCTATKTRLRYGKRIKKIIISLHSWLYRKDNCKANGARRTAMARKGTVRCVLCISLVLVKCWPESILTQLNLISSIVLKRASLAKVELAAALGSLKRTRASVSDFHDVVNLR